jgi:uncharacterized protein (DUF608 family)
MKTPMQQLIEWLDKYGDNRLYGGRELTIHEIKNKARQMLEKEKEVMCDFQPIGQNKDFWVKYDDNEQCFNETFNTKEK